jgi:hypothetical protein
MFKDFAAIKGGCMIVRCNQFPASQRPLPLRGRAWEGEA